jgi:hypothetical protein
MEIESLDAIIKDSFGKNNQEYMLNTVFKIKKRVFISVLIS